jgi:hypothetical protein
MMEIAMNPIVRVMIIYVQELIYYTDCCLFFAC